jgi:hypothetical protein
VPVLHRLRHWAFPSGGRGTLTNFQLHVHCIRMQEFRQ